MDNIKNFLESTTIHGLNYISTTRKLVRLFWIIVVIGGFTGAGILIHTAFQSWANSPAKTTEETLPITDIIFPKVTVCPPKNTYTDLNYDLMMTENMTLDFKVRDELRSYAKELLYDTLCDKVMTDLSKLEDKDRYYNWYHGFTDITLPTDNPGSFVYIVQTAASSGSISTQYFGDKLDAEKVYLGLVNVVAVFPPPSAMNNPNVTLHFDIEKVLLQDLHSGGDSLNAARGYSSFDSVGYNYRSLRPRADYSITHQRAYVTVEDVRRQKLDLMPGFRFNWYYTGMEMKPWAKYYNKTNTKAFVRLSSI